MQDLNNFILEKENESNNFSCVDKYPLAMAYIPMQKFENLYNTAAALNNGTLFMDLNKQFEGRTFFGDNNE